MKAYQEENILKLPPSKHYEWFFLHCLIEGKTCILALFLMQAALTA